MSLIWSTNILLWHTCIAPSDLGEDSLALRYQIRLNVLVAVPVRLG